MCDQSEVSCVIATPLGNYKISACSKGVHGISHLKQPLEQSSLMDKEATASTATTEYQVDPARATISKWKESRKQDSEDTLVSKIGDKEVVLEKCKSWLLNYFQHPTRNSAQYLQESPEVCLDGSISTDFEKLVWKTLKDSTAIGQIVSYGELASLIKNPKAARAVGTALKKNPVAILVPCHRVIRSDGSLGNYSGGTRNDVKKWLYDHEQALKDKAN